MGGDINTPPGSVYGEEHSTKISSPRLRNGVNTKVKDGAEDKPNGGGHAFSSASLDFEINQRRRQIVCREIFQNNQDLQIRSKGLEEAKKKILSYTPGAWIESVGAMKLMDYDVPKTTCLLLVGPKGSGKNNSSVSNGTLFLQEYMIPRGSTSFCLYDTRSLSDDPPQNIRTLEEWMRRGVCHRKLVYRYSDSLQTIKKFRALEYGHVSSEIRKVNFVVFVVDAVSVLKSIESNEDAVTQYSKMIATAFNSQHLAFKGPSCVCITMYAPVGGSPRIANPGWPMNCVPKCLDQNFTRVGKYWKGSRFNFCGV
ncbi:hypothetical protein ACLB2K_019933 [Fragaria x ananassa]